VAQTEARGPIAVIVHLRLFDPPPEVRVNRSEAIATTREQVIDRLLGSPGADRSGLAIKILEGKPAFGMQVTAQQLTELLGYPEVAEVVEDTGAPPHRP